MCSHARRECGAACATRSESGSPRWWRQPIRRCYIYVHVVADGELDLCQTQILVGRALPGAGDADLAHPIAGPELVGKDESEIEVGALAPRIRIDVAHQSGQLLERGILPCVDLQFVGRHIAVDEFAGRMMATGGAEDAQQQRASLIWTRKKTVSIQILLLRGGVRRQQ